MSVTQFLLLYIGRKAGTYGNFQRNKLCIIKIIFFSSKWNSTCGKLTSSLDVDKQSYIFTSYLAKKQRAKTCYFCLISLRFLYASVLPSSLKQKRFKLTPIRQFNSTTLWNTSFTISKFQTIRKLKVCEFADCAIECVTSSACLSLNMTSESDVEGMF